MRRWTTVAVLVALLALVGLAVAPRAAAETLVRPEQGDPGSRFTFLADGFQARERVSFWLNSPAGGVLATEVEGQSPVSADGQTSWSWVAPSGIQPGRWQMVAFGNSSQVTRVLNFTIRGQTAPDNEPQTNVFPSVIDQGQIARFFVDGYNPGETVEMFFLDPNGQRRSSGVLRVENYTASAGGRVDGSWQPLADTQLGIWQLVATGQRSGVVRTVKITVGTPNPPTARTTVSPEVGRRGMTFLFTASGFRIGEEVSVWLNAPDGRVLEAEVDDLGRVRGDAVARWSWRAPADAALGGWQMVAQGRDSGFQAVISFRIAQ